ncbi:hypothetical protein SO694_00045139 [Aureococcus anophagefferens]|uniref:Uncharacterized protein n=1 Tax=Aureococcus anophagefferens TaxID=44056 RepID=A0ABR1G865_AURAN
MAPSCDRPGPGQGPPSPPHVPFAPHARTLAPPRPRGASEALRGAERARGGAVDGRAAAGRRRRGDAGEDGAVGQRAAAVVERAPRRARARARGSRAQQRARTDYVEAIAKIPYMLLDIDHLRLVEDAQAKLEVLMKAGRGARRRRRARAPAAEPGGPGQGPRRRCLRRGPDALDARRRPPGFEETSSAEYDPDTLVPIPAAAPVVAPVPAPVVAPMVTPGREASVMDDDDDDDAWARAQEGSGRRYVGRAEDYQMTVERMEVLAGLPAAGAGHCIADSPTVHSARAIGLVLAALATAKGLELTAVTTFSSVGIIDYGLKLAGFTINAAADSVKERTAIYRLNYGTGIAMTCRAASAAPRPRKRAASAAPRPRKRADGVASVVASVVADLKRQLLAGPPADIAYDAAMAATVRDILAHHGDFVFDIVLLPLIILKEPLCRRFFLNHIGAALAEPGVAPGAAAAAVREALAATCDSLDAAALNRIKELQLRRHRAPRRESRRRGRVQGFADLESVLETGPPRVGLLGPYNRPWVVTRAAAFLGLRCPARASTTWHEATCGVLGYVADPRIKKLKASGVTPLDVLTEAVCGQEDVWFLSMAMCLASSNSQKADVATQMILPRRTS